MTLFDRLTRPLAPFDRPVNALTDGTVRLMPWAWWPSSAPRRRRPWSAGQHGAYAAWSLAGLLVGEVLAARLPEDMRSTGTRLRAERVGSGLAAVLLWVVAAGAWDRRAARPRYRRPWLRR